MAQQRAKLQFKNISNSIDNSQEQTCRNSDFSLFTGKEMAIPKAGYLQLTRT